MDNKARLQLLWEELYPQDDSLNVVFDLLSKTRLELGESEVSDTSWVQSSVIYTLYVDLYAGDFNKLSHRLEDIAQMGFDTLWLLPFLQSPMRDYGFDVSDYKKVRPELLAGANQEATMRKFFDRCKELNLKVLFDIPLNHCSIDHPLFQKALEDESYQDLFHFSDEPDLYLDARIIFKGMVESNWENEPNTGKVYFHRFYPHQPDWNYTNPKVILYFLEVLCFWKKWGVNAFRLDAIPYLWKEEGTNCENLPKTHTIIKLLRAAMNIVDPSTVLLAEACQPPKEVIKYFGEGDEVHAAYHFPLMPRLYLSLAKGSNLPIREVLSHEVTPPVPQDCNWFVFLRCHDELTLEMLSEEERKDLMDSYCHEEEWNFREGEGISARLAELMQFNLEKMNLMHALLLTIQGTPLFYYGQEWGLGNNREFYQEFVQKTGQKDSRCLVRGPMPWDKIEEFREDKDGFHNQVNQNLTEMIRIRKQMGKLVGDPIFLDSSESHLIFERKNDKGETFRFAYQLGEEEIQKDGQLAKVLIQGNTGQSFSFTWSQSRT